MKRVSMSAAIVWFVAISAVTIVAIVMPSSAFAGRTAACDTRSLSKPLAAFGDTDDYFVANGGDFERLDPNSQGWVLSSGAGRVDENEKWSVIDARHGRSIGMSSGATMQNAGICLYSNEGSMRFFYKSPGTSATLVVTVTINGKTNTTTITGKAAGWALSDKISLPTVSDPNGQTATIKFSVTTPSGKVQIDDLLIDPKKCCG